MKIEIEVTGCGDCPYISYEREHGASYHVCNHKGIVQSLIVTGYVKIFPKLCPLIKEQNISRVGGHSNREISGGLVRRNKK